MKKKEIQNLIDKSKQIDYQATSELMSIYNTTDMGNDELIRHIRTIIDSEKATLVGVRITISYAATVKQFVRAMESFEKI